MKNEMKMNNKGFSLVELIVVIAIMAILVSVLAPSVLGQIDKAKQSKDITAIDGVANACAIAFADQTLDDESKPTSDEDPIAKAGISFTAGEGTPTDGFEAPTTYEESVQTMVGYTEVGLQSDAYKNATVEATINTVTGKITITVAGGTDNEYKVTK